MRELIFSPQAWEDYLWWQTQDKKTLKRINKLVQSIQREGLGQGIGKPEPLKADKIGIWSRRIDEKNRLVYREVDDQLQIISCRYHYKK